MPHALRPGGSRATGRSPRSAARFPRRRAGGLWLLVGALAVAGLPSVGLGVLATSSGGAGGKGKGAYGGKTFGKLNNQYRGIADPTPGAGSATVMYDVNALHIQAVFNEAGYQIDVTHSFVGLQNSTPLVESIADNATQDGARGYEAGYLQITWSPASALTASQFYQPKFLSQAVVSESYQPDSTFTPISSGGDTTGAVPFGLDFLPVGSGPGQTYLTIYANTQSYTVQTPGTGVPAMTSPDAVNASDGSTVTADNITPATVLIPEPSGLVLLALGAVAGLAARPAKPRRG